MITVCTLSPSNPTRPPPPSYNRHKTLRPLRNPNPNPNPNPRSPFTRQILDHLDAGELRKAVSSLSSSSRRRDGPDLLTYSLLLKSCIRSRSFRLGFLVHESFSRSGLHPDPVFLNSLISLYAKSGDWETARRVFEVMDSRRDLVSWSSMISCLATNGMESEAVAAFVDMLGEGFMPNEFCYTAVLKACSKREFFPVGEAVFGSVLKSGHLGADRCVGCGLIDMFVKGGDDVVSAYKVFDRMPERNVVSWTLMITRFQQSGCSEDAVDLFMGMVSSGIVPDAFTLSGVVSACPEHGQLRLGRQLHSLVVKLGLVSDVCIGCSLIDMYAKCTPDGSVDESRNVFDRLREHNVMSWTAIITGCAQNSFHEEAIRLYLRMIEGDVTPNHFTFSAVIKACTDLSRLSLGKQVYGHAVKLGLASINFVGNSVISLFARCDDMENARKAFDALFEKNLVSYNTIVDAYSKNLNPGEALKLFQEIENVGASDAFTFASLLSGASNIGSIGKGEQIHARILKSGLKINLQVSNALMSMYSKCGDIEAAHQVFREMNHRNVITWTTMVTGYARHGLATRALETFQKMLEAGVKPNEVTYVSVLSACSHVGLVAEGRKHFESMSIDHGIVPRMEHYACMVDLLGRSGNLVEALEFINKLPMGPDVLVLRTFLGACQVHSNIDLGKVAAKMILEQEPDDPASYVLLSNLYASVGEWEEVAEIRKKMKLRNVTKQAGCSWIEADNMIHKFHVGDTAHPRAREIYDELDQLAVDIKGLGYVPNTDFVLHDVEEEQKEQYLFQHSEKIAVAFGLISTSASKPITIFKNLRVCGDCHTAMKYVSVSRGREIVVRDSIRFHHFKDGKCSCNDYW